MRITARRTLLISSVLGLILGLSSCKRPVEGRGVGSSVVTDLVVEPSNIKAGVEVDISFVVIGGLPSKITYELAGSVFDCEPERQADGRFHCTHPGVDRENFVEGSSLLLLEAVDDSNKTSVASTRISIDFSCPRFVALSVTPQIAEVGDVVLVNIEASEPLARPPEVARANRPWEVAIGSGTTYSVEHEVKLDDPANFQDVVVRLEDLAGNKSPECTPGSMAFAVDHSVPGLSPQLISVSRNAPGQPSIIFGEAGAVLDDVGIEELRIFDDTGELQLASLQVADDGSIPPTSIGLQPATRIQLQAVDRFGRMSPKLAVAEQWKLSIGQGTTPGAALKSAVRFSAAPPGSDALNDKTLEFAPDVLQADARAALIRARVGFVPVGDLPNAYEDTFWIPAGYDAVGDAIVAFGGVRTIDDEDTYKDRVLVLRWDERAGVYDFEFGQPYIRGMTPSPRGGHKIAFDGSGCGIMFGGKGLKEIDDEFFDFTEQALNDIWQVCYTPSGYRWTRIVPTNSTDDYPLIRRGPLAYDPEFDRYLIAGGFSNAGGFFPHEDALILQPGSSPNDWQWIELSPLPSTFGGRHSHMIYYDPEERAIAVGLGFVQPTQQSGAWWTYKNGQWSQYSTSSELRLRQGFDYAYDEARKRVVLWGENDFPFFDEDTWFLSGTSTNAATGWRRTHLDPPVPRAWPTLVYDPDRQVTVVFGGLRFDERFVPPDIHEIISSPSWPHLSASIDLAARRPKGIERLHLDIRAGGFGDLDGEGPSFETGGGVVVKLWDHNARAWVDINNPQTTTESEIHDITIDIVDQPERFVSPQGTVPITITTLRPATEALSAELQVDQIDGFLELRSGVTLP